jgi:hypothetical protein
MDCGSYYYSRFAYIDARGTCIVGMKRVAMIPLLSFEVVVNVGILASIPLKHSNDKIAGLPHVTIPGSATKCVLPILTLYATNTNHVISLELYSYKHNMNATLRTVALRTFIGSCATLTSSVANITVLMVLEGEPGWVCMMCCNSDSKPPF